MTRISKAGHFLILQGNALPIGSHEIIRQVSEDISRKTHP